MLINSIIIVFNWHLDDPKINGTILSISFSVSSPLYKVFLLRYLIINNFIFFVVSIYLPTTCDIPSLSNWNSLFILSAAEWNKPKFNYKYISSGFCCLYNIALKTVSYSIINPLIIFLASLVKTLNFMIILRFLNFWLKKHVDLQLILQILLLFFWSFFEILHSWRNWHYILKIFLISNWDKFLFFLMLNIFFLDLLSP